MLDNGDDGGEAWLWPLLKIALGGQCLSPRAACQLALALSAISLSPALRQTSPLTDIFSVSPLSYVGGGVMHSALGGIVGRTAAE